MDIDKIKRLTQEIRGNIRKVGFEDISTLESKILTATQLINEEIYTDDLIEKTAKKMFEDVGYKLVNNDEYEIRYSKYEWSASDLVFNLFSEDNKFITVQDLNDITLKEIKAINQQLKELGWL